MLDIGCGEGAVLRQLAEIFPRARFTGIDSDERAIARARQSCGERIEFRCTAEVPSAEYDLVLTLDTLHEVRRTISDRGRGPTEPVERWRWIIVEAAAGDTPESNLNPSGRLLSAVEMLYCVPTALERGAPA